MSVKEEPRQDKPGAELAVSEITVYAGTPLLRWWRHMIKLFVKFLSDTSEWELGRAIKTRQIEQDKAEAELAHTLAQTKKILNESDLARRRVEAETEKLRAETELLKAKAELTRAKVFTEIMALRESGVSVSVTSLEAGSIEIRFSERPQRDHENSGG